MGPRVGFLTDGKEEFTGWPGHEEASCPAIPCSNRYELCQILCHGHAAIDIISERMALAAGATAPDFSASLTSRLLCS